MKKILLTTALFFSFVMFAQTFVTGQEIYKNVKRYSPSQNYYLIFQNDGNLVMYTTRNNSAIWSSKTTNSGRRAVFQDDGNLVIYNRNNSPVFSANTTSRGSKLEIQDDGNLVIYDRRRNAAWSSMGGETKPDTSNYNRNILNTGYRFIVGKRVYSPNNEYYVVFQDDGNMVVYNRSSKVIWQSNTYNKGTRAIFQEDGNLVIYDMTNHAVFSSGTTNTNARTLIMQDDGNFVIYDRNNKSLWGSNG